MAYFAASTDAPETNEAFARELGIDFPILSDPSRETATAFGVVGPGREHAARWTFYIGADGQVLHVDKEVKPASHGPDVARTLARLGVKKR